MKFVGVNILRINKETVQAVLLKSFHSDLFGNDLCAVKWIHHFNGDVTIRVLRLQAEAKSANSPE